MQVVHYKAVLSDYGRNKWCLYCGRSSLSDDETWVTSIHQIKLVEDGVIRDAVTCYSELGKIALIQES